METVNWHPAAVAIERLVVIHHHYHRLYSPGWALASSWGFVTIFLFLRGEVVSLTPNTQPGGSGYPFLSGSSPLTCLAWEALPVAYAITSIAFGIIWPHKPCHYTKVGIPSGGLIVIGLVKWPYGSWVFITVLTTVYPGTYPEPNESSIHSHYLIP